MIDINFFRDLKGGVSNIMGVLLYRQNVTAIAEFLKVSPSLVYAWVNPGQPQIPNMEQFFKAIQFVSDNNPGAVRQAVQMLVHPCGFQAVSDAWISKAAELKALSLELQGGPNEKEILAYPPTQRPLLRAMMEEATAKAKAEI